MIQHKFWKKILTISLAASLLLSSLAGCSSTPATQTAEKTIQILATSDVHGFFDTYNYETNKEQTNGSLTQVSHKVQELRAQNPNTLLLDNGDAVQGNLADRFIDDEKHPMYAAFQEMKYDLLGFGNHEFNYGPEYIDKFIQQNTIPFLCANIYNAEGKRIAEPYVVKNIDGVRVGLIGLDTPNITTWDGKKYPGWSFKNPVEEARAVLEEMKTQNLADVYVGLCHMGIEQEMQEGDNLTDLANACPEFSAIIAGHSHTVIPSQTINNVVITQPGQKAEALSQLEIKLNANENGGYAVQGVSSDAIIMKDQPIDENLNATLKPYHDRAIEILNTQIGTAVGEFTPKNEIDQIPQFLLEDTPMVDLINNTQSYYASSKIPQDAKLLSATAITDQTAYLTDGSGAPTTPITVRSLNSLYYYENYLNIIKLSGEQLKKTLEWDAEFYNQFQDGDTTVSFTNNSERIFYSNYQFSNCNYQMNISKPVGSRIENLSYIDGSPIENQETYYLATSDYFVNNFINTKLFPNNPCEIVYNALNEGDLMIRDQIASYIHEIKGGTIYADQEFHKNWELTGINYTPGYHELTVELLNNGTISLPGHPEGKLFDIQSVRESDVESYKKDYPQFFS